MKQLWSVLFSTDFCSFSSPNCTDNSCINRTDTIVKISSFLSHRVSSIPNPYPIGLILANIYTYIVLSETRTCTQGGEERRMLSTSISCKVKLTSLITHLLNKLFLIILLIIERQQIILSNEQIRLLDCSYIDKFSYIIEREWHFNDMYHTNMVLFDILLNVNRCRRCFHKFLSNMTLIIIFCLYISLYSSYTTNESTV